MTPFIPQFRVYAKGILHVFDPIYNTDEGCLLCGLTHPLHCLDLDSQDVVITTSSGYYDRTGKPIFEGDTIINHEQKTPPLPVCHGPFGWYAGYEEGGIDLCDGKFFSSHEDGTPRYERCGWLKNVEIVGNIWNA